MKKLLWSLSVLGCIVLIGNYGYLYANQTKAAPTDQNQFAVDYSGLDGTQAELNQKAYQELKRADAKLNEIYKQIFVEYKRNKLFLAKLTQAESAWLKYRDAQLEARFPGANKQELYGSAYPMSYYLEQAAMTWERVKELNRWLTEPAEGDIGNGSYGQKEAPL